MAPRARARKMRKVKRKGGYRGYKKLNKRFSKPTFIKRLGQLMRIGNDTVSGLPVATLNGNTSLIVGTPSADSGATQQVGSSIRFKLNSTIDHAEFTNLFDRYKITGVKLKFMYQHNIASNNTTANDVILPVLSYSFDGDDASVPASYNDIASKQYVRQKILNGNTMFSVYYKPRISKEIYRSTTTTGYSSEKACWLNSATDDIHHFGVKMWLNNWTDGVNVLNQLTITPTYYLALRDTQ